MVGQRAVGRRGVNWTLHVLWVCCSEVGCKWPHSYQYLHNSNYIPTKVKHRTSADLYIYIYIYISQRCVYFFERDMSMRLSTAGAAKNRSCQRVTRTWTRWWTITHTPLPQLYLCRNIHSYGSTIKYQISNLKAQITSIDLRLFAKSNFTTVHLYAYYNFFFYQL